MMNYRYSIFDMPTAERAQIDRTLGYLLAASRDALARNQETPLVTGFVIDRNTEGDPSVTQFGNILVDDSGFVHSDKRVPYTTEAFDEKEGAYTITAEVPGIGKDDVNLEVKSDEITFTANSGKASYARTLHFETEIDPSSAKARCENGVLTLQVKLREEVKPRAVKVNVE